MLKYAMLKYIFFIEIVAALMLGSASASKSQDATPELWQKAEQVFRLNKDWVPGSIIQRTELLSTQNKIESTNEVWIEYKSDTKEKIKSEIIKVLKNGKDATEEFKNKHRTKNENEDSASFDLNDNPFNPDLQKNVSVKLRNETQNISGKKCIGFDFIQKTEYKENNELKKVTNKGKAWLDSETGYPLKLEYTADPLPKRMKRMWTIILYETSAQGNWYPKEMILEGEGAFLFIKKIFRTTITFSNFWKQ